MIMDGSWNGSSWRTFVGRTSNEMPDFVHPASAVGTTDANATVNVAFVDGHVELRRRGDGTGQNDVPTSLTDIFWSGLE